MANKNLKEAKKNKNDEFYTQLADIEKELKHYKEHFKGKTILWNCDDPRVSNFFHYFSYNFEYLGLKRLITTCYKNQEIDLFSQNNSEKAIYLVYDGNKENGLVPDIKDIGIKQLKGDGDFRSQECIELLKQADIVVTNPPFSLFREYVAQLIEYDKKFIIIGNMNAITYKEIFKLIKENNLWLGYTSVKTFLKPDGSLQSFGNVMWFTNLEIKKRNEKMILYKQYYNTEEDKNNPNYSNPEFPKYDNYNAINVDKTSDIPLDYDGVMGVPITFLDKYNPEQFEIVDCNDIRKNNNVPIKSYGLVKDKEALLENGRTTYARILIRRKNVYK